MRAPPVRQTGSFLALSVLSLATIGPLGWPLARTGQDTAALPDPIPIQRIQIPPERLPIELKRRESGVLVQMPRSAFEAKVQQAARAVEAARDPPRLVEARYSARLDGSALNGTGEWRILGPGPGPSVLPLQALGIALNHIRMQPSQGVSADAIVGGVDGKRPGLLLERGGPQLVVFDWSARGEGANRGLRFDLQVPPAVAGSLELRLPTSPPTQVETETPALVSGPYSAETADWQTWHIRFNNQSQIRFVVRRGSQSDDSPPLVRAALQSRLDLTADAVRAEYQFHIQASREGVRELKFLASSELQPMEVDAPDLDTWETEPAEKLAGPIRIVIRMRMPMRGGLITIRCQSPLPLGARWPLPALQIPESVDRGESIQLRLMADMRLEDWQSGVFQIIGSSAEPTGVQVLRLERKGLADASLARPSAHVRHRGPEIRARSVTWWQIASPTSTLTIQIKYDVMRGKVFQLPVAIPAGWQVEQVTLSPTELLRSWNVDRGAGQNRLFVELQRGLGPSEVSGTASTTAQLFVKLRPESTNTSFLPSAAFPEITPLGATLQESVLGIGVGSTLDATVATRALPAPSDEKGPWGRQALSYSFRESGRPVRGLLNLRPRSTRLRARCATEVIVVSDSAQVRARVHLQPDGRNLDSVVVSWSAPTGGVHEWKIRRGNNRIVRVTRLQSTEAASPLGLLAARTIFEATALAPSGMRPAELYRVSFAQPVKETLVLDATCEVAADEPQQGQSRRWWQVPLVAVLGSDSANGELDLCMPNSMDVETEVPALQRLPDKAVSGPLPLQRFQYRVPAPVLTIRGDAPGMDARQDALVSDACLRTVVRPDSPLLHKYSFHLKRWNQKPFPVRLPDGAEWVLARMDGYEITDAGSNRDDDKKSQRALPVPAGPVAHDFTIVYTTPLPTWNMWIHIAPPPNAATAAPPWAPELPIRPSNVRYLWSFPSGVRPIEEGRLHSLNVSTPRIPSESLPRWVRHGLFSHTAASDDSASLNLSTTSQFLEIVHGRLAQRDLPNDTRLKDLLGELASDPRLMPSSMVIDNRALADVGLNPTLYLFHPGKDKSATRSRDVWEQLGLAVLALDSTFVITTTRAAAVWKERSDDSLPLEIEQAIHQAVDMGRDASGRFCHLANWLNDMGSRHSSANGASPFRVSTGLANLDEMEWESDITDPGPSITLVNEYVPTIVGFGLAALTLLASWVTRRLGMWTRLISLGCWLMLTGLGTFWLPAALRAAAIWPALAAGFVSVVWYAGAIRRGHLARMAKPSTGAASLVLLFGGFALIGHTAAPEAAIVWLVGKDDGSGAQQVFAAPELLKQLDALGRQSTALAPRGVIVQGDYHGTVRAGQGEFQAEFLVYCPTDDAIDVTVPLSGVQLREAFCDGAAAHPRHVAAALPGVAEAYLIELKGRGLHAVRLSFTVPISGIGYVRDLKFGVPDLVACKLDFELPGAAEHPEAVAHRGISRLTRVSGGPRLEVELGRVSNVHLRWFEDSGGQAAMPRVREGYLWELRPTGSVLTGVLQYSAVHKPIPELEIETPEGLELANVGLARLPGEDTEEASPRLRSWYITGAGRTRRLHLELEHPLTSGVQVILEMVPREPFPLSAILPVPLPVGGLSPEGPGHESFLAYRTSGLEARVDGNGHFGVTGIAAAPFGDFWRTARLGDPGPDLQVYSFRRVGRTPAPFLRLRFRAPQNPTTCVQDVQWKLQRGRVECVVTGIWSAPTDSLVLLEWEIPRGVNVSDVSGAEVRDWSLTGSRLQVWLDHAVRSATVTVTGSTVLPRQGTEVARGSASPRNVTLAAFHAISAAHTTTFVRIMPSTQLVAEPSRLRNLWPLPSSQPLLGEFAYVTDRADHGAVFLVRPNVPHFDAKTLTLAEVVDRAVHFRGLIDCRVRQGQLRTLTIRVRNWDSGELHLEGVRETIHAESLHERNEYSWKLDLPPNGSGTFRIQVSGSQPLRSGGSFAMPVIEVTGADHVQQWVAMAGRELQSDELQGLEPVVDPSRALSAWPSEAERIRRTGTSWAVLSPDWRATAVFTNRAATPGKVHIALCQQRITNDGSRHWLHQTSYWLYHDAGTDLFVRLPTQARLRAATVDNIDVPFASVPSGSYWIRLATVAGLQDVTLSWCFDDGAESFVQPRLDLPRPNAGEPLLTTIWTLGVPPEYRTPRLPGGKALMPLAQRFLHRAEAQLRLSALAANHLSAGGDGFKSALSATQERFFRYLSLAALCGDRPTEIEATINDLRDRNRRTALAKGYADIRAKAEQSSPIKGSTLTSDSAAAPIEADPALEGAPISWESDESPEDTPAKLHLEAVAAHRERWSWLGSLVLVACVFAVWLVAASPSAAMLLQKLWPEQALILAMLLWFILGGNAVSAFLAVVAVVARLLIAWVWLRGKIHARAATAIPSGS